MAKNITQITSRTTAPDGSLLYIGYPDVGNPYGYSDSYITKVNFEKELQADIDTNTGNISSLGTAVQNMARPAGVIYDYGIRNSNFNITVLAYYEIEKIIVVEYSGTPLISVGTYSGASDLVPEMGCTEPISTWGKSLIIDINILNSTSSMRSIYVNISGGFAQVMAQLKNRAFV